MPDVKGGKEGEMGEPRGFSVCLGDRSLKGPAMTLRCGVGQQTHLGAVGQQEALLNGSASTQEVKVRCLLSSPFQYLFSSTGGRSDSLAFLFQLPITCLKDAITYLLLFLGSFLL